MWKVVAGLYGGFIFAYIGAALVTVTFAAFPHPGSWGKPTLLILWVVGIVIAVLAKSASKAWRRLLVASAILSFLLPLSGMISTGSSMATDLAVASTGVDAAGVALGGGLVIGFIGFVGFFFGMVFLAIGLLVGRDKQIVHVQAPSAAETPALSEK